MGAACCRRGSAAERAAERAADDEALGPPCPKAPRVDSSGYRILVSPSSGVLRRSAQRTPFEELPVLN